MDDPHGTRGSTERHALDYKGEVKAYSSADILAAFAAAQSGAQACVAPAAKPKGASEKNASAPSAADLATSASTYHALTFKGEVRAFNSSDLLSNMMNASAGKRDTLPGRRGAADAQDSQNGSNGKASATSQAGAVLPDSGTARTSADLKTKGSIVDADPEAGIKIRPWAAEDSKNTKGSWSVDRLKDALAMIDQPSPIRIQADASKGPAPTVAQMQAEEAAQKGSSLVDSLIDVAMTDTSKFAPLPDSEWADFNGSSSIPPPGPAAMSLPANTVPQTNFMAIAPPQMPATRFMPTSQIPPPPQMPPPQMPPPQMPPPQMPPPQMPPPQMPPPQMPPPQMPPPQMPPPQMPPPQMPPPQVPPPQVPPPQMPPPQMPPPQMPPPQMPPPQMLPPQMPPPQMSLPQMPPPQMPPPQMPPPQMPPPQMSPRQMLPPKMPPPQMPPPQMPPPPRMPPPAEMPPPPQMPPPQMPPPQMPPPQMSHPQMPPPQMAPSHT